MKLLLLLLLLCGLFPRPALASTGPGAGTFAIHPHKFNARDERGLRGKRPGLKQRIALWVLRSKMRKWEGGEITEKQRKQAKWALTLGIACFVLPFIPVLGIFAIPAAVVGLVLGIQSVKGNSNSKGIIGIVLCGTFLLLLIAAIVVLVSLFASFG